MLRVRLTAKSVALGLAFVVTCVVVDTAEAQRGGARGRGRGPEDMVTLAANEQVQKELAVTDEQKPQITKIAEAYRDELRQLSSGSESLSREERAKQRTEQAPKRQEIADKHEKELAGVLKEDQQKRLKEITIQVQGGRALLRPDVSAALKLSDEQKQKIKQVLDSQMERGAKVFADAQGDREALTKKLGELRKEIDTEAVAVLNKDQQTQFESMKGEKFELQRAERRNRDA
ncbi:MAG: hypothetical protein WD648_04540 [Planctomycetaceae bacterium]